MSPLSLLQRRIFIQLPSIQFPFGRMESAISASRGAIAGCLRNDVADGWGRLSLSSKRQIASRFEFSNESHLQYYGGILKPYCGKKNKSEKLKLKHLSPVNDRSLRLNLLELTSKDLPALATAPADASASLTEQARAEIITNAVNVMMKQLEQAKAERKERKRQLKAQKKALKLAEKQRKSKGRCEDSSSSSDSDTEVVDMTRLRSTQQADRILEASDQNLSVSIESPPIVAEDKGDEKALHVEIAEASDRLGLNPGVSIPVQEANGVIKVCMGGKCKKSGSEMLLGAFEERLIKSGMGFEVEAVGCKCMGKCRNAPNVRVQTEEDSGKGMLHMGFSIGDVDHILAQCFGLNLQPPPSPKEGQIPTGLVPT